MRKYENKANTFNLQLVIYPDGSGHIIDNIDVINISYYILEFSKFNENKICDELKQLIKNYK